MRLNFAKGVAVEKYPHLRGDFGVFGKADVTGAFEVAKGVERLRSREAEGLAEFLGAEAQMPPLSLFEGYLVKYVQFLVDVGDIFQARKRERFELMRAAHVAAVPEQHCIRRLSIAASTARLLEIGLGRLGNVAVHHEAHIRLVYAHAEGIGADHHPRLPALPGRLATASRYTVEPGMIERGTHAFRLKEGGRLFAAAATAHIDYSGTGHAVANVQ